MCYVLDDLLKAREKSKKAEIDSELGTDTNDTPIRRRRKSRKYESSASDEGSDSEIITYPKHPTQTSSSSRFSKYSYWYI